MSASHAGPAAERRALAVSLQRAHEHRARACVPRGAGTGDVRASPNARAVAGARRGGVQRRGGRKVPGGADCRGAVRARGVGGGAAAAKVTKKKSAQIKSKLFSPNFWGGGTTPLWCSAYPFQIAQPSGALSNESLVAGAAAAFGHLAPAFLCELNTLFQRYASDALAAWQSTQVYGVCNSAAAATSESVGVRSFSATQGVAISDAQSEEKQAKSRRKRGQRGGKKVAARRSWWQPVRSQAHTPVEARSAVVEGSLP